LEGIPVTLTAVPPIRVDTRSFPALREVIEDPDRVRDVVRGLVMDRRPGLFRSGPGISLRAQPVGLADRGGIIWRIDGPPIPPPFLCQLAGDYSVYQFPARHVEHLEEMVVTPMPEAISRLRSRTLRRAPAHEGWTVSFRSPSRRADDSVRPVHDVSIGGLSFRADPEDRGFHVGLPLPGLVLRGGGMGPLVLDGEVRRITRGLDGPAVVGVRVRPRDEGQWSALIDRLLYPRTSRGARWGEACWRLYEATGYFALSEKAPADFQPLKEAYLGSLRRLDDLPGIGCQAVWPAADGALTAAVSVLKVYEGTWLGLHMAKIRGDTSDGVPSGRVLREIHYRAYEYAQRDPGLRWLISYCQDKPIWSRLAHHDFPRRHAPSDRAEIVRFRALEVPVDGPPLPHSDGFDVGPATPPEVDALSDTLAAIRPRAYREALDLMPGRFESAGLRARWAGAGLARERAVLVARRGRGPLAAAVVEDAEEGLHLFHLLKLVRLFELAPDGMRAFGALLQTARAWFDRRGRRQFVCFLEGGSTLPGATLAVLNDLGLADMVILSADLLPDLLEHIREVTVPRDRSSRGGAMGASRPRCGTDGPGSKDVSTSSTEPSAIGGTGR
jgi:hypothetical protein